MKVINFECEWCDIRTADKFTPQGKPVCISCYAEAIADEENYSKETQMAKGSALKKEMRASDELRAIVKEKKISRGQMMKSIWKYIKRHKLQSDDKRIVECDDKLTDLFKKVISKPRKLKMRGKT